MHHTGTLYLSRQKPVAKRAADGTLAVTLLAYDRIAPLQVEPYLITWTGPAALGFWAVHADELVPGAALQVELERLRMHVETGRHSVGQIVAAVKSLQVLPKAAISSHKKTASSPCAA